MSKILNGGLILLLSLGLTLVTPAFAGMPYESGGELPDPFSSKKWYDERQELARHQYIPEPIEHLLPFWINPLPEKIQCNEWVVVTGHIPWKDGVLTLAAWSPYSTDGDTGIVTHGRIDVNMSYNPQYELQNYFYMPCDALGEWSFQFNYYPNPEVRSSHGVVPSMSYMSLQDSEVYDARE